MKRKKEAGALLLILLTVFSVAFSDTPVITELTEGEITQECAIGIVCRYLSEQFSVPEEQIMNGYDFISVHGDIQSMVWRTPKSGNCWHVYVENTRDKRKPFTAFDFYIDPYSGEVIQYAVQVRPNDECRYLVFYEVTDPCEIELTPNIAIQTAISWINQNMPKNFPDYELIVVNVSYNSTCEFHNNCSGKVWEIYLSNSEYAKDSTANCTIFVNDETNVVHAVKYSYKNNEQEWQCFNIDCSRSVERNCTTEGSAQ